MRGSSKELPSAHTVVWAGKYRASRAGWIREVPMKLQKTWSWRSCGCAGIYMRRSYFVMLPQVQLQVLMKLREGVGEREKKGRKGNEGI